MFCEQPRPLPDFTQYHRHNVEEYGDGHDGDAGYWLAFMATSGFELLFPGQDPEDARQVQAGIDRDFAWIDAPAC